MMHDKSGNITRLERWDNRDAMNILHYTYDGNQVTKVTDQGYGPLDYGCKRYMDLADENVEMDYVENSKILTIGNIFLTIGIDFCLKMLYICKRK